MISQTAKVHYHDYLKIDQLLNLQEEVSSPKHPDELLFITVHQGHELWFKLFIHELRRLREKLARDQLPEVYKTCDRLKAIVLTLISQISVLETLSPDEFLGYRELLAPASGFQSFQYRMIEFLLGIKEAKFLELTKNKPDIYALLESTLKEKSLYDEYLSLLKKRGFDIPADVLVRDLSVTYEPSVHVAEEVKKIYTNRDRHSDLYWLSEILVDLDTILQKWRGCHLKIAERTIGFKKGTGGSKGVEYLSSVTSKRCFPELWDVRSLL